ncbi:unnamed protein product [Colias eurytheme]|nr:unnamed protein product [Colias eurytheme]
MYIREAGIMIGCVGVKSRTGECIGEVRRSPVVPRLHDAVEHRERGPAGDWSRAASAETRPSLAPRLAPPAHTPRTLTPRLTLTHTPSPDRELVFSIPTLKSSTLLFDYCIYQYATIISLNNEIVNNFNEH